MKPSLNGAGLTRNRETSNSVPFKEKTSLHIFFKTLSHTIRLCSDSDFKGNHINALITEVINHMHQVFLPTNHDWYNQTLDTP